MATANIEPLRKTTRDALAHIDTPVFFDLFSCEGHIRLTFVERKASIFQQLFSQWAVFRGNGRTARTEGTGISFPMS